MNSLEYVFAVVEVEPSRGPDPSSLSVLRVHGTAFCIGPDTFMTAHHVAAEALACPEARLAYGVEKVLHGAPIAGHEFFPDLDLAILRGHVPIAKTIRWRVAELPMLEDVFASGYPYALDETRSFFSLRAFKGYVVSRINFTRLPGNPRCYELSFQAPRGLSGAPLWTFDPDATVQGVVIGNHSTEMLVFSSRESVAADKETIVERFEAMQAGVALQSMALVSRHSSLLGSTIQDYLKGQGLC